MDWGFIIQIGLAAVGAALVAGGIVAFRGSTATLPRTFGASAVAAGVVMLAIVVLTIPASTSVDGGSPAPAVGTPVVGQ